MPRSKIYNPAETGKKIVKFAGISFGVLGFGAGLGVSIIGADIASAIVGYVICIGALAWIGFVSAYDTSPGEDRVAKLKEIVIHPQTPVTRFLPPPPPFSFDKTNYVELKEMKVENNSKPASETTSLVKNPTLKKPTTSRNV